MEKFIIILLGIFSGTISGMGMGGGSILIILLSLILNVEQRMAQATNLVFFIPTSIAAIIVNLKNKNINMEIAIVIIISGIIGTIIGAIIGFSINSNALRKYFGIFLLLIAMYEFYNIFNMFIKKKV